MTPCMNYKLMSNFVKHCQKKLPNFETVSLFNVKYLLPEYSDPSNAHN